MNPPTSVFWHGTNSRRALRLIPASAASAISAELGVPDAVSPERSRAPVSISSCDTRQLMSLPKHSRCCRSKLCRSNRFLEHPGILLIVVGLVAKREEVEHLPIRGSVYVERLRRIFFGRLPGSMDSDSLAACNRDGLGTRSLQNGCSLVQDGVTCDHLEHVLSRRLREPGAGHAVFGGDPLDEERRNFTTIDSR